MSRLFTRSCNNDIAVHIIVTTKQVSDAKSSCGLPEAKRFRSTHFTRSTIILIILSILFKAIIIETQSFTEHYKYLPLFFSLMNKHKNLSSMNKLIEDIPVNHVNR